MREELNCKKGSGTKDGSSGKADSIQEAAERQGENPAVGGHEHSAEGVAQTNEKEKISPHDFVVRYNPPGY